MKEPAVVDTNVIVTANGRAEHASPSCALASVEALQVIVRDGRVVIDDGWVILSEYQRNASSTGQPGAGDAFLRWVLVSLADDQRCERLRITRRGNEGEDFEEFPSDPTLAGFDPADRKFVAVALAHPDRPPILNATDTDWYHHHESLARHGIRVMFLCPDMMPVSR